MSVARPTVIQVVTWNIAFGRHAEQAVRELSSIDELSGADVVLLQEMDEASTALIAERLGMGFAYTAAAQHARTGRDFGNAILSRWPVGAAREIELPHRARISGQPRSATHAIVTVSRRPVSVFSVHTEIPLLTLGRRIDQFQRVADSAASMKAPTVVGGDFNTATHRGVDALNRVFVAAGLSRASGRAGATMTRAGRAMELDHLFARGFEVRAAGVARQATASDHWPLWAEIELSP